MPHLAHPGLLLVLAGCVGGHAGDGSGKPASDTGTGAPATAPSPPPDIVVPGDNDGDHYVAPTDCDDTDASIHPGATETCNGRDDNCDGVTDADAVDISTWYVDSDHDSYGAVEPGTVACNQPHGTTLWGGDCNDGDPAVHPNAAERCDGVDHNCSGSESDAQDAEWWYLDADEDGWGNAAARACEPPVAHVDTSGDCDDANPDIHPAAAEVCDTVDNDCDRETDESDAADAATWYLDADGDSYGVTEQTRLACDLPAGFAAEPGDCDDSDEDAWPGAPERCDGADNDCDGTTDEPDAVDAPTWYPDDDDDSFGVPEGATVGCDSPEGTAPRAGDCDDTDPSVHPNATEACDATVDTNCDGAAGTADGDGDGVSACQDCDDADVALAGGQPWYADADSDGYGDPTAMDESCFGDGYSVADDTDCDDTSAEAHPGAEEVWYTDVDEACDGGSDWDADGDGYDAEDVGADCDDADGAVNPGAEEECGNGRDDDCSGDGSDCALRGDVSFADADVRYLGMMYGLGVGISLAGGLDLGDGNVGMLVGAEEDSERPGGYGAVYVLTYSGQGDDSLSTWRAHLTGEGPDDQAGSAVAVLGDVDGDGVGDFAVGVRANTNAYMGPGAAYLVSGAVTGTVSLADATAKLTPQNYDYGAGSSVEGLGDTNGDGTPDWAVGAEQADQNGADSGAVYLLSTPMVGDVPLGYADAVFYGEGAGDQLGETHVGSGDMNGDGYRDFSAGSTRYQDDHGIFYVCFGPFSGAAWIADADIRVEGEQGENLGKATTGAGDLDGDGYEDFAVSGSTADGTEEAPGKVSVFSGPLTEGLAMADAIATVEGEAEYSGVGRDLDRAGDMDGDGFADLLVGAVGAGTEDQLGSGALVMYGPVSGAILEQDADLNLIHEASNDYGGQHVAGTGDVNSDGYDDILVSAVGLDEYFENAGVAYLFLGSGL